MSDLFRGQDPADSNTFRVSPNPSRQLSEHFQVREFRSKDGTDVGLIHPSLLAFLERLRERCGDQPIRVNSGFRTHAHNESVGGASESKHLDGMAADIVVIGVDQDKVYEICEEMNPGGLAREAGFIHIDVFGQNRRWEY